MTSFRFNFTTDTNKETSYSEAKENKLCCLEFEEICPTTEQLAAENMDIKQANIFVCDDVEIGYVTIKDALDAISNCDNMPKNTLQAEEQHSDIVAGRYEGGLKVWECTSDLIHYLNNSIKKETWDGAKVLDLGCGAGILGIYTLINGAEVHFQDYNKEVLSAFTIPNVILNLSDLENINALKKSKFYSGDWASFDLETKQKPNFENDHLYDFILSSETIYNTSNYSKLIKLFQNKLKNDGVIYIAAKMHYFGVGGGIRQFEKFNKETVNFETEICWKSTGGIQREIVKLYWKK